MGELSFLVATAYSAVCSECVSKARSQLDQAVQLVLANRFRCFTYLESSKSRAALNLLSLAFENYYHIV